ncbi:MAG: YfiR family protein, partial [Chitinophagaceae bacterium]
MMHNVPQDQITYVDAAGWRDRMKRSWLLVGIFFFTNVPIILSQHKINYASHANIIYRFTKYVDWPADRESVDFIIGIVGETPLFEALHHSVKNKLAGSQKISIRIFDSSSVIYDCHI